MTDDRTLGQHLHEARRVVTDGRDRPWPVEDWADRDPVLQARDEQMAAAVAAVACKRIARECERRARALPPSNEQNAWFGAAGVALAAMETQERSDEKESP